MTPTYPRHPVLATAFRHTVEVPFDGDGAATGALNWGQQHILGAIRNL
ncbi:MAG: hypothetical protein HOV83_34790, partial [Catenulispora sp.]|nr:hypothetical protein [Catenulispora sp.]